MRNLPVSQFIRRRDFKYQAPVIWWVPIHFEDTVASTRTLYVQVGVKRHSQRESLAIIAKNNFRQIILPSSIYTSNEPRMFLHHRN